MLAAMSGEKIVPCRDAPLGALGTWAVARL
jgi:hypothetical protein